MDIWGSYPWSWTAIWCQIFHILFIRIQFDSPGASGQFQVIPQHKNSSRNSILTTRSFRNWPKFRNYEKHNLSDKTVLWALEAPWNWKFRCWRSKSYKYGVASALRVILICCVSINEFFYQVMKKQADNIRILSDMAERLVVVQRD